jgi:hypothetical protein
MFAHEDESIVSWFKVHFWDTFLLIICRNYIWLLILNDRGLSFCDTCMIKAY